MIKKLLTNYQKQGFNVILSQKPCCRPREFNKILASGNVTEEDLLQIEVFLRTKCYELHMLTNLYEDYCIRKAAAKKKIDDPTLQEKVKDDRKGI